LAAGTRIGTAAVSASVAPEPATIGISVLGMVGVWAISASFRQRAKQ
jgi:hypothetical protein